MGNGTIFEQLQLTNWRQFATVDLEIHPRLTVITGSNGAGKSTILSVFSQNLGWRRAYLSTPKRLKNGSFFYDIGVNNELGNSLHQPKSSSIEENVPSPFGGFIELGKVRYSSGVVGTVGVHEQRTHSYELEIRNPAPVFGVHVGSHRTLPNYHQVANISLQPMQAAQASAYFNQELMNRYGGEYSNVSPIYRMKEALIAMAAFGEGNSYLKPDTKVLRLFEGFVEILKKVLPEEVGFTGISIRIPDVVIETRSGEFMIDSASGGINALIEIAWQIYLYKETMLERGESKFVVTMDEPENHLHPSMQRAIIPALMSAFDGAQFIVATHSPFVVSAVEDSFVYVLTYDGRMPMARLEPSALPENRRVISVRLDNIHKGGTAGEILRQVLGVHVTTPDWVQQKVNVILDRYIGKPITNEVLSQLRKDLSAKGFGELYPEALSKLVEHTN